jgi:[acyl-carrier-protein] S-malonyltransferase
MTEFAYVFPGQGAQSVGMMSDWGSFQAIVSQVYEEASEALGYDLWSVVTNGPEDRLNQTELTQPAMLCAGVASWRIVSSNGFPAASLMAGHSLGEYTALVCSESLQLTQAVELVARRGKLMQTAVPEGSGSMAAIIGLEDDDVIAACKSVSSGIVEAVNFNAPGQVVIAGEKKAVVLAMEAAKSLGAKRALPLSVSVPSHCSLMTPAAELLAEALESIDIKMPRVPVIHNQSATEASSVDQIRKRLKLQLSQPVKWVASVQYMHQQGVSVLIECGPGKVLTGLTRRIEKTIAAFPVFDTSSFEKSKNELGEF